MKNLQNSQITLKYFQIGRTGILESSLPPLCLQPALQTQTFISFTESFHGNRWARKIDLLPTDRLHSSVCRALHRRRRGHGFFSVSNSRQLLKLSIQGQGELLPCGYFPASKRVQLRRKKVQLRPAQTASTSV